jgi:hypothetical protein
MSHKLTPSLESITTRAKNQIPEKEPKLLIINCHDPDLIQIPMGSFGICDYLRKKKIKAKILNLAIYSKEEYLKKLDYYLNSFKPTHVGLTLHWKELVMNVIQVGEHIKSRYKDIKILCGGFTAGYFSKDLLNELSFLDYVILGDPEKPLELLLKNENPSKIPNLIYRNRNGITHSKKRYHITGKTLSEISFSNLNFVYDYKIHINNIERSFGFPVFIGRGCTFDCDYCGGSSRAFKSHSFRSNYVTRSIESIIKDLVSLKEFTNKIYICYENDIDFIKSLFKSIIVNKDLSLKFYLNYGFWRLADIEFLTLYKEAFNLDSKYNCFFEISPEILNSDDRMMVKDKRLFYSNAALKNNLKLISRYLEKKVDVHLYLSRYHKTQETYNSLKEELRNIAQFKNYLRTNNLSNVKLFYENLSTDPGSYYWDKFVKKPKNFNTLLFFTKELRTNPEYKFLCNDLCIYHSEKLSKMDIAKFESMVFFYKLFEKRLFRLLCQPSNEDDFINFLEAISTFFYRVKLLHHVKWTVKWLLKLR